MGVLQIKGGILFETVEGTEGSKERSLTKIRNGWLHLPVEILWQILNRVFAYRWDFVFLYILIHGSGVQTSVTRLTTGKDTRKKTTITLMTSEQQN